MLLKKGDLTMNYLRHFYSDTFCFGAVIVVVILLLSLLGCALKAPSPEDLQQLETAKILFETQIENDMHSVIWTYLDEVLHDPYSFRLQRFEYTRINHYSYKKPTGQSKLVYGEVVKVYKSMNEPVYQILMRFRVKVPSGGFMLKEMYFYLLKNKHLRLPNGRYVPISSTP